MGAVLSLFLAEKYPEIKALLLYSPAIKITRLKFSKIIRHFKPIIQKKNHDEILPWQGYSVYPLYAASEFQDLQKMVVNNLFQVQQPIIIFHGAFDHTIDLDSSDKILTSVKSLIKYKHILANSGHVLLLDKEFDKTADMSWNFIQGLKIV
jgi:carboxylesterase